LTVDLSHFRYAWCWIFALMGQGFDAAKNFVATENVFPLLANNRQGATGKKPLDLA